jgi:hypothetical protein
MTNTKAYERIIKLGNNIDKNKKVNCLKIYKLDNLFNELENKKHGYERVVIGNQLHSRSKQYSTDSTTATIEFYKNGNIKNIKVERISYPNYKCYHGYDASCRL